MIGPHMPNPSSSEEDRVVGHIVQWQTPEEMFQGFSVIRQMYSELSPEHYRERLQAIREMNYRQFAYMAKDKKDKGDECLGVVGLWLFPRLWCGLQADIDNFIVDEKARSLGVGRLLLNHCLAYATERGANIAVLDTYVENARSHRFYFREGFSIRGYHFIKPLQGQSIWDYD